MSKTITTRMNKRRIKNAQRALEPYRKADEYAEKSQHVVDLLADVRHYCEANGIDYHKCERMSYEHYIEERRGEE